MIDYLSKRYGNRNPYFEALLKEGTNTSPIGAHSQGMSRLAFALLAGLERGQMDRYERLAREDREESLRKRQQLDQQPQPEMPSSSPPAATPGPQPSLRPAADTSLPPSPPAQMPLVLGPSGQPVPPSGIVGDPINIFDPRSLTRRLTRRPPL
jgi:hypothetical protein